MDNQGKLWLQSCGTDVTNSLHLFQFDGYEFKLVKGALERLDYKSIIAGVYKGRELVGSSRDPNDNRIFFFNFHNDSLSFYPAPTKGKGFKVLLAEDDKLMGVAENAGQLLIYEWVDRQWEFQTQVNDPYQERAQGFFDKGGFYRHGAFYWKIPKEGDYIRRFDSKTNTVRNYTQKDFEGANPEDIFFFNSGSLKFIQGTTYFRKVSAKTETQLFELDKVTNHFKIIEQNHLDGWNLNNVFEDQKGNILYLYKNAANHFSAILKDQNGTKFDYSAFFPDQKDYKVANIKSPDFKQQVLIFHQREFVFHEVKATDAIRNFLPHISTRAMAELPNGQVLVTTQGAAQSFLIERKTGKITQLADPDIKFGMTKLHRDQKGNIWSYTGSEIIKYNFTTKNKQAFRVNVGEGHIRIFTFIDNDRLAVVNNRNELYLFDLNTGNTFPYLENGEQLILPGFAQKILFSKNGFLWVATSNGLCKVDLENKKSEVIGLEAPFLDFRFLCMDEDAVGRLWLGTSIGGLHIYDPNSEELIVLNANKGLVNNTVASILEDDEGVRWLGTYNGISLVSPDGDLISNLYVKDGLSDRECNRYSALKASDGTLFIGTVNGVNEIDPKKIKERLSQTEDLKIYLTRLTHYDANAGESISKGFGLNSPGTIHLPASQRFMHLSFATSNHFRPTENQYAYMLEGIDKDWTFIGKQRTLSLNNLPPGDYRLLVKARTGNGKWTPEPITLAIVADEYFYKKPWFYLFCLLISIGVAIIWILRLRIAVKKATRQIYQDKKLIEQQAEKLLELDAAKSRFFTNISHEFRTPLTIISGMIDQVMIKPDLWLKKGGSMIKENSVILLNLVNQILDLRKLESKNMQLNFIQGDVIQYLRYVTEPYKPFAKIKGITLHFLTAQPALQMDYDSDKLLRIISNLLSNAIKYTPEGGNIYLHIDQKDEGNQHFLHIRVEDTGDGIPEDQLSYIFDRFYQVDDSLTRKGEGAGIGLALTNELVKLLNGEIEVKSEVGKGTTFVVKLPITTNSIIKDVSSTLSENDETMAPPTAFATESASKTITNEEALPLEPACAPSSVLPSLLIVEDNPDVVQFLVACLEDEYQLQITRNGQEGIDAAIENVPDLIVSDVLMPEKDGFELCDTLKQDERTSHIPIILLTAKADLDSKISGLERGADAYLTKPFESKELLVRLKKLLELRQKLQERYLSLDLMEPSSNPEDEFIQNVRKIIHENIDDDDFGIVHLCKALAMSRTQVHHKTKALTGKSTSIFIRSIRLYKAKELLKTTDLTVSQIAYEVGFKYPANFSNYYLEEFGEAPSRTRK